MFECEPPPPSHASSVALLFGGLSLHKEKKPLQMPTRTSKKKYTSWNFQLASKQTLKPPTSGFPLNKARYPTSPSARGFVVNGLTAINYCPLGIYKRAPFAARASWFEQRCRPLGRTLLPLFFLDSPLDFPPPTRAMKSVLCRLLGIGQSKLKSWLSCGPLPPFSSVSCFSRTEARPLLVIREA